VQEVRIISDEKEWRNFDDDKEDKSRVGNQGFDAQLLSDGGLSTVVQAHSKGQLYLASVTQRATTHESDRVLLEAFRQIDSLGAREGAQDAVTNQAKVIFKDYVDGKPNLREVKPGIAAACLYLAFRSLGFPRTFKELGVVANVDSKVVYKGIKDIGNVLRTQATAAMAAGSTPVASEGIAATAITPADHIDRFAGRISLTHLVPLMKDVASRVENTSLMGKQPATIASAVILFISVLSENKADRKTVEEVCEASLMALPTVLAAFRTMLKEAALLLPPPEIMSNFSRVFQLRKDYEEFTQALITGTGSKAARAKQEVLGQPKPGRLEDGIGAQ
jgi:transcription initiation factor TFIIIB Brf1 subunit/transcription initiation factor TFIIB